MLRNCLVLGGGGFIGANLVKELIKNGIYEEESSIIRIFVTGFYNFMAYIGLPMKALGWICEKLGEGIIEYLSLPESVWNTSSPDYFLKRENILETLIINPKLISQIRESLVNDPNKIEINDLIPNLDCMTFQKLNDDSSWLWEQDGI